MDLAWGGVGERLYLLASSVPHLRVLEGDGIVETWDLDEVSLPAGLARIPGEGGFYVSDRTGGRVFRFDPDGRPTAVVELPGRPGALALSGVDAWCVLEDEERVCLLSDPELTLLEVPGGGGVDLAAWRSRGVASAGGRAFLFGPSEAPVELDSGALSVTSWNGGLVLLLPPPAVDSCRVLFLPQDSVVRFDPAGFRPAVVAASPSGRLALVDASGTRVMLDP